MEISLRNGLLKYDEKNSNSQLVVVLPPFSIHLAAVVRASNATCFHCFRRATAARRKSLDKKIQQFKHFSRFEHFTLIKL